MEEEFFDRASTTFLYQVLEDYSKKIGDKMRHDLISKELFFHSPSWQTTKYAKSTARKDKGQIYAGDSYFLKSSGKRIFNSFNENFVPIVEVTTGDDGSILAKIHFGDEEKYRNSMTPVDGTKADSLYDLFVITESGKFGRTNNRRTLRSGKFGKTGKRTLQNRHHTGHYQIYFFDDLRDYWIPKIKRDFSKEISKTVAATVAKLITAKVKQGIRNKINEG